MFYLTRKGEKNQLQLYQLQEAVCPTHQRAQLQVLAPQLN